MSYKILDNISGAEWNEFLIDKKDVRLFHSSVFYNIYTSVKLLSPLFIAVVDVKDRIVGIALGEISNELFDGYGLTRHTTFYAEPLYNGDLEVLKLILETIKKKSKGLCVEIRPLRLFNDDEKKIYQSQGFHFNEHLNSLLPLTSEEEVWNNLSKDKQDRISKNQNNIIIKEKNDIEGVEIFYSLLKNLFIRKRHFIKSKDFFIKLLEYSNFHYLIAYENDMPVATQLYYIYNKTITAYYTATDQKYLSKHPGDILIWHLIQTGLKEKCILFDFGGGGDPNKYNGIREYKKRFGTQFENVGRYTYNRSILFPALKNLYSLILKQ